MTTQTRPILRSQRLRMLNHQGDALRLGMNWTEEDLGKPQVLVDSAYGMGHPGTFHFRELVEEVSNGVYEAGGKPAEFAVSDICDGVVQATSGMSYSLVSRDIMAAMVEIHALGHLHDGMVLISGNDKSVPAHLVAIARCDLPAIHLPGGTQLNAPDYVTSDQMWEMGAEAERVDLGHRRHDVARHQRVAHPARGLDHAVADVADGEHGRLAASLIDPVADLFDQLTEMERAGMPHPVSAVHQDLRLAQVLLGPVHPKAQRVTLAIDQAQPLAAQHRPARRGHRRALSQLSSVRRVPRRVPSHRFRTARS